MQNSTAMDNDQSPKTNRRIMKSRIGIKNIIAFIVSIGLLIYLFQQVNLHNIVQHFTQISWLEFFIIAGIYFSTVFFRGLRINSLVQGSFSRTKAVSFSAIHSFANHVFPFRMGELVLPWLFNKYTTYNYASSFYALVLMRLYDLIVVLFIFTGSFLFYYMSRNTSMDPVIFSIAIFLEVLLLLGLVFSEKLIKMLFKIMQSLSKKLGQRGKRFAFRLSEIEENITALQKKETSAAKYIFLPAFTFALWMSNYIMFFTVLKFLQIKIGFWTSVLGSSGAIVTNLLPINGLGSFGTLEAGWTLGFMFVGLDKNSAIASSFVMHIIVVFVGMIIAGTGFILLQYKSKTRQNK
ncbi:MAG: lysylphosphatidylglycerol synthase transmembrane domain-containing protein [Leptospirales bacterium]